MRRSFDDLQSPPQIPISVGIQKTKYLPRIPTRGTKVPDRPEWLHEIKYDGYRLIIQRDGKRVRLFTRNGHDWSHRYPLIMARRIDDLASFEQGEIGPELFRHACLMGLEGLIPKHRESAYRAGRSPRWMSKTGSTRLLVG